MKLRLIKSNNMKNLINQHFKQLQNDGQALSLRTMYQGNLYTITTKGDKLITAYYDDSDCKVCDPSLLHNLEYYLSKGLHTFKNTSIEKK